MKRTNRYIVMSGLIREFAALRHAADEREVARLATLRRKADEATLKLQARRLVEFRSFEEDAVPSWLV